ncbi:Krr1-domain-containing protein [Sistotremastrum niveocremeum HHB9708]|uniref:Krr1-domain-containing protein n=1 Tax=Sistotremastrum niveocremeum HHB9708 TaxID=1314777 RepID=A0A164NJ09_9AGAM|nr:Krr1-domain-containing protein [Sistotremastrum niveocremeum HHB9708]
MDDDEDSEDEESEDEDGEELTPATEVAILRTLARIRKRDPRIYESGVNIFQEEQTRVQAKAPQAQKKSKDPNISKPITLKQQRLQAILGDQTTSRSPSPEPRVSVPTYAEEQQKLRNETINVFHEAVGAEGDDNREEEDDFLIPREKTRDEIEREEEEYREFLEREVGEDIREIVVLDDATETQGPQERLEGAEPNGEHDDSQSPKKKKKKKKQPSTSKPAKSKEEADQEFLVNYILNRGWVDQTTKRVPTYHEVTAKQNDDRPAPNSQDQPVHENTLYEDDEDFEQVAEDFETSYNFRFEEPGAAAIATYPRNLDDVVRRPDTSRKEAREKKKERKAQEKELKKEEIRRLKGLKVKELREKLERIGKEGGIALEESALEILDIDGDWDPENFDKQMKEIYNEGYDAQDDDKPHWDDDISIDDIVAEASSSQALSKSQKKKVKKRQRGKDNEDGDEAAGVLTDEMDAEAEHEPDFDADDWDGTEEMRKKKLDEYMEKLYALEFNDLVGDLPTRFKYTQAPAESFSLSAEDILLASDKDLNEYMGLKKYAPYRKAGSKVWDKNRPAKLRDFKAKLNGRSWGGQSSETQNDGVDETKKRRKGKKERERAKLAAGASVPSESASEPPRKKQKQSAA